MAMNDLDDFELTMQPLEPEASGPAHKGGGWGLGWIIGIVVFLMLASGAAIWRWRWYAIPPRPSPTPTVRTIQSTPVPTPRTTPEVPLPTLDQSDDLVRSLVKGLSAHPQLGLWLAQKNLIRLVVAVIANVDEGESPRAHLRFLTLRGGFDATQQRSRIIVDPTSYLRYDFIADAVESLDIAGCVGVYQLLLPLEEEAYRELGHPQGGFTRAVERALHRLLEVPVVPGDVVLRQVVRGNLLLYEYSNAELEALSPAQKHLLRMGPRNVSRIQAQLRDLAVALGFSLKRSPGAALQP